MPNGNGNNGNRDKYFLRILVLFGALMLGVTVAIAILAVAGSPSDQVILRMTGAIGSMFSGMLGLTIGYLTGRR